MNPPIKKIVFIEPKSPGYHVYTKWGLPRLGTIQLGTILEKAGYDVSVFIENIHGIDFNTVLSADAVGISTITSTAPRAYELARQIRKVGIPVFMGGPHVSFLPEEALQHCDFVMCGEADETILSFIQALESGRGIESVRGVARLSEEGVIKSPLPDYCQDLDKYPLPNFKLIKGNEKFSGDLSVTPIMTSRGCPFGCNFCSVTRMFGRKYRFRSIDNVIEELHYRQPEWVFFYDDNFAADTSHTKGLLRRMIAEKIFPKWSAQVRIDVAKDEELLELMKRANCVYLYIGLESINPQTLKAMNKGQTPADIENAIKVIHSYGINIHGMFILGADHDDVKTIRETVRFAKKVSLASIQMSILTPMPGTPVFQQMEDEGRIISHDWGYYDGHHVVFRPKKISFWQLQKQTFAALLRFYSLGQIFDKLNQFDIWTMIVRIYGWKMSRRAKRSVADFTHQLKERYKHAGDSLSNAGQGLQLKARRTTDDLKEYFSSINFEKLRALRQVRLDRARQRP